MLYKAIGVVKGSAHSYQLFIGRELHGVFTQVD